MRETKDKLNTSIIKSKNYWQTLGPGLTTGAADDDPAGIATYTQAGASRGFTFLWTALITFPMMALVQEMCARLGVVTGRGLAGSIRLYFPKPVLYFITALLFVANTFNIGANLALMGEVANLLLPGIAAIIFIFLFSIISLVLQIFTSYKDYAQYLKWLALVLVAYIVSALALNIDWPEAIRATLIPQFSFTKQDFFLLAAIIGTTISPFLFFWQTSQEVEEEILRGRRTVKDREKQTSKKDIRDVRIDVWSGMFISNVVMYFIILASAGTLFGSGVEGFITASQAAEALKPVGGNVAYLLFSLGVIGTGMLAIPVQAGSSSYAISESFGWREGLYRKFKQAHAFYGVIIISVLLGIIINLFRIDAISMLLYSALTNAIIAPFILVSVVLLSSNKKIMGAWVNSGFTKILGWLIVLIMFGVSFAGIWSIL